MLSSEVAKVISTLYRIAEEGKPDFFGSKYGKWLCISMLAIFSFMVVLAVLFHFTGSPWLKLVAIILTLVFYFSALLWQVSLVIPALKFFRNPTGDLLKVIQSGATNELSSMAGLATVPTEAIQYVADRMNLASRQLWTRTAFFVGAVEKVGVLPGIIASLVALSKVSEKNIINADGENIYFYIASALFIFYGFAVVALFICQKFEVFSGALNHYLHFRANRPADCDAEIAAHWRGHISPRGK